jgi:hypothetical protein
MTVLVTIADTNIELLVTDVNGRRTGFDPSTGSILQEIPGSTYSGEALQNVETGGPSNETGHQMQIDNPSPGPYQVIVTARQPGLT